ncbi:bacteriohemerythrin [Paramaledivibacter caminithermalis]|jgi:hemerythrin|uniref:Hemerythrin n=1 Tax=Paramaledivibacter caminithermalis (strain DSM 15212 / CIP 107654 / DViRD3) TaxID=1121301 RepID=A0A1M6MTE7_PARC5|nr:bacteriohemerythrin [Paramaledivibacter caminithermalis]SHJ86734.1 hemerythrin [Paramaledivibacter caminithermalis DSM 15212]
MFKWKELYSCNISKIDDQHKKLFEIGYKLSDLVRSKDDLDHYDEIIELINELTKYTIYHFETEEKLMEEYGFNGLEEHKKTHKAFVDKISQINISVIDEEQKRVMMEILVFIADWIEDHILKVDHMYKDFLNEKGVF